MSIIYKIRNRVLKLWWDKTIPYRLRFIGVEVEEGCHFYGMPIINMASRSRIKICKGATICSDARFTSLGVSHPTVLRTLTEGAEIVIGSDSGVSGGSISAAVSVSIGKQCLVGADVTIADTDFHSLNPNGRRFESDYSKITSKPVSISNNVFIGCHSIILKGVTIEENSVVGAGSVVTKNIPTNTIFAGNPAKKIGSIDP